MPDTETADPVELGVGEQGAGGGETAAGLAGDPDPIGVEPRMAVAEFADRGDVVVKGACIAEVAIGVVVKGLAAPGGTAPVDGDDRKSKRGKRFRLAEVRLVEGRSCPVDLRPWIDVVNNRIAPLRVEAVRPPQQPVDRGVAVGGGRAEPLGRSPAKGFQRTGAWGFELDQDLSVTVQHGRAGRFARRGGAVDEIAAFDRADGVMVEVVVGESGEPVAVEIDSADLADVWVAARRARLRGTRPACGPGRPTGSCAPATARW